MFSLCLLVESPLVTKEPSGPSTSAYRPACSRRDRFKLVTAQTSLADFITESRLAPRFSIRSQRSSQRRTLLAAHPVPPPELLTPSHGAARSSGFHPWVACPLLTPPQHREAGRSRNC